MPPMYVINLQLPCKQTAGLTQVHCNASIQLYLLISVIYCYYLEPPGF